MNFLYFPSGIIIVDSLGRTVTVFFAGIVINNRRTVSDTSVALFFLFNGLAGVRSNQGPGSPQFSFRAGRDFSFLFFLPVIIVCAIYSGLFARSERMLSDVRTRQSFLFDEPACRTTGELFRGVFLFSNTILYSSSQRPARLLCSFRKIH